jgi:hypothetical protein
VTALVSLDREMANLLQMDNPQMFHVKHLGTIRVQNRRKNLLRRFEGRLCGREQRLSALPPSLGMRQKKQTHGEPERNMKVARPWPQNFRGEIIEPEGGL